MKKGSLILISLIFILSSCGSSTSTRTVTIPPVTYTSESTNTASDSGSSNSDVISGSVSVPMPNINGFNELTFLEAKELAHSMSEYQNSEEFVLPSEIDTKLISSGMADGSFDGDSSLNNTERCVFSKDHKYYRHELSSASLKTWKYIGEDPSNKVSDNVYIEANQTGMEGTYSVSTLNDDESIYIDNLQDEYHSSYFDLLTGNSVLNQLDIDESNESVRIDCHFYSKGAGSLIVYGSISMNNYKFDLGNVSLTGSLKSAIAYTWDNYIIVNGETDSLFLANFLFRDISGSFQSSQSTSLLPTDFSKPNYSNFTLVE